MLPPLPPSPSLPPPFPAPSFLQRQVRRKDSWRDGRKDGGDRERYSKIFASAGLARRHLIYPAFVTDRAYGGDNDNDNGGGKRRGRGGGRAGIESMPGVELTPVGKLPETIQSIVGTSGISSLIIFGVPRARDESGSQAAARDGVVQRAVRSIKETFGRSIEVITDVCVCQYNLSGHCGLVSAADSSGAADTATATVDNDRTLGLLSQIAASHAEAGADMVAPSAMMDGQVRSIRSALDSSGYSGTRILSYSAKHASSLYSPFRSAAFAKSSRLRIDKSSYQVSYANPRQAMREIESDIAEGADMVMVKPGLAYLDLVVMAKERFGCPVAVQNVSGEYAMIKAAGAMGWVDEDEWKVCSIASIRRAGADRIISYFAAEVAPLLAS